MKKNMFYVSAVILISATMTIACSNNSINGTWQAWGGNAWVIFDDENVTMGNGQDTNVQGKYEISGNVITVIDNGNTLTYNYSVENNTLILEIEGRNIKYLRKK